MKINNNKILIWSISKVILHIDKYIQLDYIKLNFN